MKTPAPKVGPDLKSVSPSQIKEYERCPRLHWLNKRAGLPQPEADHLIVGTAAHAAMESYFETSVLFEPVAFATKYFSKTRPDLVPTLTTTLKSALLLLADPDAPKPKPGLLIETPRNYNTGLRVGGITLRQRSDLLDPTDKKLARTTDWKTSGNVFSDFTKTGEELTRDPQGVLYAYEAFEKFKPEAVEFRHGVMGTKQVEADLISTGPMSKEHIDAEVKVLDGLVREMSEHFAIDNFHQTRPGKGAPSASWGSPCRAYKGCPYAALCGVELPAPKDKSSPPTQESSVSATPNPNLTLKERIAMARKASGLNPPDAAKPAPVTPYDPAAAASAPPPTVNPGRTYSAHDIIARIEADLAALKAAL